MADDKQKKGDEGAAKSAADEARERAAAQRAAQSTATGAAVAVAGSGDKVAPGKDELTAGEQAASLTPDQVTAILARMAQLEALVAGASGLEGPAADATKSTVALAPGAVQNPQHALRSGSITSAPDRQPIAKATDFAPEANPAANGTRQRTVQGARVLLTKPHYIGDAIRNEGEVLEDYTGPVGSGMVEVDEAGKSVKVAA